MYSCLKKYELVAGRFILIAVLVFSGFTCLRAQVATQTFTYTGSLQSYTIPPCVNTVTIEARGAGGGSVTVTCTASGGLGASMIGTFTVIPGQVLSILVGQVGQGATEGSGASDGGGGGGSYVVISGTVPLIVAGGGGGATNNITSCGSNRNGLNASTTTSGTSSGNNVVAGGVNGNGGGASNGGGGGGGGFYTNGTAGTNNTVNCGKSYLNGGAGGTGSNNDNGGYGGGGAGWYTGGNGGGGGGYSGGGTSGSSPYTGGGGGGSYNSGSNQINTAGVQPGNGLVTISYPIPPTVMASVSPSSICIGGTSTLSAFSQSSYTWNNGSNSSTIAVSPSVTTNYTVVATNSAGCISSTAVTVFVNVASPTLSVFSSSAVVCAGATVNLTGSGATTYTWTGGINNGVPFTPLSSSNYTLFGSNSCGTSSATISVSVNPAPGLTVTASSQSLCLGNPATLTATGANSYTWTGGVTNGATFIPLTTSSYTVSGTSAFGCTASAVANISVVPTPTLPPTASQTLICFGSTCTLSASGASAYLWTPGNLTNSVITVSPLITTTYTITKSNGNCTDTKTINITVKQLPVVTATANPGLVCPFASLTLSGSGAQSYTWMPVNLTGSILVLYPSVNTVYTVSASDGTCVNTATVAVAISPNPTISVLTNSTTLCQGSISTLTLSGAATYTLNPGNLSGSQVAVSPLANTVYTIIGSSLAGCTASTFQLIQVIPSPTINIIASNTLVCPGGVTTLTATGANNYTWSNSSSSSTITVIPVTTTTYAVTGFGANGCSTTSTVSVGVLTPTFSVPNNTGVCQGNSMTLTASGASSYTWNGSIISQSIAISPVTFTVYAISATSSSNNVNCVSSQTVGVSIYPNPTVTATSDRATICKGEQVVLAASGASTYTWNSSLTAITITISPGSPVVYTVIGVDANGCMGTATVQVKVSNCTGIEDRTIVSPDLGLKIYPNPNNGEFLVKSSTDISLRIVNELGQVMQLLDLNDKNGRERPVCCLTDGIYFVLGQKDNKWVSEKISVSR